jgi:hypothetical protein
MIVLQAVKGLAYAHKNGLIHRDVKPGNVFISRNGRVKVFDFGLAYASESVHLTTTDAVLGTPLFMSPEQAKGEKEKDLRMEVLSVGVLLYRLIAGKYPFVGNKVPSVLYAIIHTKEQDIQSLDPSLPDDLAENIRLCLEKDKENRLGSLDPLIESLENYFYDMGIRDTAREIEAALNAQATGLRSILRRIVSYHVTKGKDLSSSGEVHKSRAHLVAALRHDPGNREIADMLGQMEGLDATMAEEPSARAAERAMTFSGVAAAPKASAKKKLVRALVGMWILMAVALAAFLFSIKSKKQEAVTVAPVVETVVEKVAPAVPEKEVEEVAAVEEAVVVEEPEIPKKRRVTRKRPPRTRYKPARPAPVTKPPPPPIAQPAAPSVAPPAPKPAAAFGKIKVRITPPQAAVFIGNLPMDTKDKQRGVKLKPGSYTLRAAMPGYESHRETVEIEPNMTQSLAIRLKSVERGNGFVHIFSKPWAEVYIDGRRHGNTPTKSPVLLSSGKHQLLLKRAGFQEHRKTLSIVKNDTVRIRVTLER